MSTEPHFMEALLDEVIEREQVQSESLADIVLIEIRDLTARIETTLEQAAAEKQIIDDWALTRSAKLQERIDFLSKKLEAFIAERNVKTIDLVNGQLKVRKKPDRVEVDDMEQFLLHASRDLVSTVPESVKPDLMAIRQFVKRSGGRPPKGVRIIEGKEEFSYKLKGTTNGKLKTETAA